MRISRTVQHKHNCSRSASLGAYQTKEQPPSDRYTPSERRMLPGVLAEITGSGSSVLGKSLIYGTALTASAGVFLAGKQSGLLSVAVGAIAGIAGGATLGGAVALGLADNGKLPVQIFPLAMVGGVAAGATLGSVGGASLALLANGPTVGLGLAALALPGALVAGKVVESRAP